MTYPVRTAVRRWQTELEDKLCILVFLSPCCLRRTSIQENVYLISTCALKETYLINTYALKIIRYEQHVCKCSSLQLLTSHGDST